MIRLLIISVVSLSLQNSFAQISSATPEEIQSIWKELKKKSGFKKVFKKYKNYRFEFIFTEINRDLNGGVTFKNYHFGDSVSYFYPASTVKLPLAIATTEMIQNAPFYNVKGNMKLKLDTVSYCDHVYENFNYQYHRIKSGESWRDIAKMHRLSFSDFVYWNSIDTLKTPIVNTSVKIYHRKVRPSINELISSMLVYSDNDAYNRLFEMAGGNIVNNWLEQYGFVNSNVSRKFLFCEGEEKSVSVSYDILNDKDVIIYHGNERTWDPAQNSSVEGIKVGKEHYFNGELMRKPRDFSDHNRLLLSDLHEMMQRLLFPSSFSNDKVYKMEINGYKNIIRQCGYYPAEHPNPLDTAYDGWEDGRNIFLFNGNDSLPIDPRIRIVNITGQAYGFSTDAMYFTDDESKTEFMLSARIYTNKNGVLGDDKYEYVDVAMPLMKYLGEYFFEKEKQRKKEVLPNFAMLHFLFN